MYVALCMISLSAPVQVAAFQNDEGVVCRVANKACEDNDRVECGDVIGYLCIDDALAETVECADEHFGHDNNGEAPTRRDPRPGDNMR